jgi:hypothetical protein
LEDKLITLVGSRVGYDTATAALQAMQALDVCPDMAGLFRDLLPA